MSDAISFGDRAGSIIAEAAGSHEIYISKREAVATLIALPALRQAGATREQLVDAGERIFRFCFR